MGRIRFEVNQGCTLCGMCVYECAVGAIVMSKSGAVINQDRCTGCGSCYRNCASEAIKQVKNDN